MSKKPTRREILKTAATTTAISAIATAGTAADSGPTVRVVEAGIRYEVPEKENFHFLLPDSRPPYTVDSKQDQFVLAERVTNSLGSELQESGMLLDERSPERSQSESVTPEDGRVGALPTELSARMRAKKALDLASSHRVPSVVLQRNGNAPSLSIEGKGTFDLEPETERQIRLPSETAEARTVSRTETTVEVEGRPEDRQGPRRIYGSTEVEVTPVVEVVDHGELALVHQQLP